MYVVPDLLTISPRRRTVTEIQRKISRIGKRGGISRLLHAKNDGDTITAWRLKLREILHVFNVRPILFLFTSLTVDFQTELAINTHVAVLDTKTIALGIQRTLMEHAAGGRRPSVSNSLALCANEQILTVV